MAPARLIPMKTRTKLLLGSARTGNVSAVGANSADPAKKTAAGFQWKDGHDEFLRVGRNVAAQPMGLRSWNANSRTQSTFGAHIRWSKYSNAATQSPGRLRPFKGATASTWHVSPDAQTLF